MSRQPEPVQVVKSRRDAALTRLTQGIPFAGFLGTLALTRHYLWQGIPSLDGSDPEHDKR